MSSKCKARGGQIFPAHSLFSFWGLAAAYRQAETTSRFTMEAGRKLDPFLVRQFHQCRGMPRTNLVFLNGADTLTPVGGVGGGDAWIVPNGGCLPTRLG